MALTTSETLQHLYSGGRSLQYIVRVYIRADVRHEDGQGGLADATTTTFATNSPDLYGQIAVGDIIQMSDEDMLVTNKGGSNILTVKRGYASTVATSHESYESVWVWREFTDRVGQRHALDAVSSIRRSFEASLGRYETSISDLKALNADRFWDDLAYGTGTLQGFTSLRNRWVRFYLLTRRGADKVDHRAVATMMLDDVKTDMSQTATIKLVGIGSLLRKDAEADRARNGREWFTYVPTPFIVERLLASVDELRGGGAAPSSDLPRHWKQQLKSMYGRTIALPAGQRAFSPFGKAENFRAYQGIMIKDVQGPSPLGVPWSGGHPTALAWDPQVSGTWVKTGDPARAGRLYFGRGADIVEFDPVTMESAVAVQYLNAGAASNPWQIRRLWYNSRDPATAGKPKICGVAWTDYNDESLIGVGFGSRGVYARLFRWNGGTSLTTTRDYTNNTFWPGTHFFRFGEQRNIGAAGAPAQASMIVSGFFGSENVVIPFPQRIYSHATLNFPQANGAVLWLCASGIHAASLRQDANPRMQSGRYLASPGTYEAAASYGVPGSILYTHFYAAMHYNNVSMMNLRYTMGQQGACSFSTDFATGKAFIQYCTIDTGTGAIKVRAWDVHADTVTDLHTYGSDDDQPCSAGGVEIDGLTNHFCVGRMLWKERTPADNESYIDRFHYNGATWARTQIYASTGDSDSAYNTPLWLLNKNANTGQSLVVSWMARDLAKEDMYGINSYDPASTITNANKKFKSLSMLHAMVVDPAGGGVNNFYGIGTDGVVVRGTTNGNGVGITDLEPLDRGLPPIDGENWSAIPQIVADPNNTRRLYGVSSPVWPFGEDVRGNNEASRTPMQTVTGPTDANKGMFVLWKHDTTITDIYEIGYFENKTVEDALADLAFASDCVWGFDGDGRGNFKWAPRQQSGVAIVTFDRLKGLRALAKAGGNQEIENQVEITPFVPRMGDVTAKIELTDKSPNKSGAPIEVEANGIARRVIVLKCIRGGRVGGAAFSFYSQNARYKTWLAQTYPGGAATGTLRVFSQGRSAIGPYDDREVNYVHESLQVPKGAQIYLPDGSVNSIAIPGSPTGISVSFDQFGAIQLTLQSSWTPPRTFYAGTAVEIDLEFAQRETSYIKTDADADGKDVLVSSYDWQEIGGGKYWRTGVFIRFIEPTDDGTDVNYNEVGWAIGERIVIDVPGLDVIPQDASKIIAFDSDSIVKFGKKTMRGRQAVVSPRRAIWVADNRLAANKRPRYIYQGDTDLAPYISIFDRVAFAEPNLLRALDPETVTVRAMTHDLVRGTTIIEGIGSAHD